MEEVLLLKELRMDKAEDLLAIRQTQIKHTILL